MSAGRRIALVTGANRGIGRSAALQLASEGVDLIVTYRSNAGEAEEVVARIAADGRRAVALQLDVGEIDALDGFVASLDAALADVWGRTDFDYLVNNGGMQINGSLGDVSEDDFDRLVNVHFKGVFFLTQKLVGRIVDGGAIVNISSSLARHTAPERVAYGPVKAAVEMLTRYLAKELGPRGIRVNALAPGVVATDFADGLLRGSPELQEWTVSVTALGRYAVAEDIGPAIAALLSDSNSWVTGQVLEASGGMLL